MKRNVWIALAMAGALNTAHAADQIEVLHWWTSGGESKAVGVLKQDVEKQGVTWKDFAVAGGSGTNALTVLKTNVVSGHPPSAAQLKGPSIHDWAEQGVLVDIDSATQGWDKLIPQQVGKFLKYDGHYVAVPVEIHRMNWLWINKEILDKVGGAAPNTWPEFFALADKMKAAGYTAVAHGGQPWQDVNLWEGVVLSQGADFYRKAIVELDPKTLTSDKMVQVFDIVRKIGSYYDNGTTGRDWNLATMMVINGKAGMQFMADWAKGEFARAGKVPGKDYICAPRPGTAGSYMFNSDSLAFFSQNGSKTATPGQLVLAKAVMSPDFQEQFSLYKGSIPARIGIPMDKFDDCAKRSYADEQSAIKANTIVPSLAQGMAQTEAVAGAMTDVVTKFMHSQQDSKSAVQALATAAKAN
ncbi:extracellular solute-binding protein [Caballeronia arvi]|uniref:Probable sugar-binding periplasmic protein n=1 Tax=Caballeronia arvi TaxID=1777135 RepID=A0A158HQ62_9BURK|nr:ABC transporter substrate-binding protein [Caballeronia arvi]SAL45820.1 extracellular solute-binding protein [Caballeronia arvi]